MYRYEVTAKQTESVLRSLRRGLPLLSEKAIRLALKKRDVLIDQKRTGENQPVAPGAQIVIYTAEKAADIPIIFEDGNYLVLNKPANVNVDPNHQSDFSLLSWAQAYLGVKHEPVLCHRLDNQTTGLVCLAKSEESAEPVLAAFRERRVLKRYECLVLGVPHPANQVCGAYLSKDAKAGRVKVFPNKRDASMEIVTEYETLLSGEVSRLLVTLHTGRTHQIRAHLAFLGYPVIGDDLYGSRDANRQHGRHGLKLCAVEIGFPKDDALFGLSGKILRIPPPF